VKNPVKFGKYYLLERISVGGMAEVFKAKAFGEAGFERLVAVKRILPSIAEDQEFIAMFVDEAKLAVQLTHPNIAQIFELGKVGESYFIALEYVAGRDMRAIFERARKRSETLPIPMACYMVMKLCEGLDYAHNKKDSAGRSLELVHRDVSPQNILMSNDGDVKLIDFGIAKAASKSSKTQAGILKGKFGYMSPEQVRGLQVDRRSDIFAVGICLYELLTMERLFVGESDFSTLEKVRNVEIVQPSAYNKKIPEELENIVLKALAKHPEDRYRSAMDLHDDLQSFMYTSGNFFARKDLSVHMHKLFEEEIRKENARDDEFRKFDSRRAAEAEVFESAAAPSGPPAPSPRVGVVAPPLPPSAPPAARTNGAPPLPRSTHARPGAIPAPPPRSSASVPVTPMAASAGVGAAATVARAPTGAMPVHAAAAAPAPVATPAAPTPEMDLGWEDDESATQIMDKPPVVASVMQSAARPAVRMPTAGGPVPRITGQIPALPALPGRPPVVTALGVAPPPATSLQPAVPLAPAPPVMAPSVSAPPVPALGVTAPLVGPPPGASVPAPNPNAFNNIAPGFTIPSKTDASTVKPNGAQKADWPANAAPPQAQVRKKDTRSTMLLAFFGVIAVAAVVVLALQLSGPRATGAFEITTTEGSRVLVNDVAVTGNGTQYIVGGLQVGQQYQIVIEKPGFERREVMYTATEGATRLNLELSQTPQVAVVAPPPVENPMQQLAPPPGTVPAPLPGTVTPGTPAVVAVPGAVGSQQLAPPPQPVAPPVPVAPAPPTPRPPRETAPRTTNVASATPRPPRPERPPPQIRETTPTAPAPTTQSATGGTGTLMISTNPASRCTVNGQTFSTPRRLNLPPGRYSIACVNEELASRGNFSVTITAGQTADLRNRQLE
jgi:serine/threonine protein kinase